MGKKCAYFTEDLKHGVSWRREDKRKVEEEIPEGS